MSGAAFASLAAAGLGTRNPVAGVERAIAGMHHFPVSAAAVPEGRLGASFRTAPKELDAVSKALAKAGWTLIASEMRYLAKTFVELPPAQHKEVTDFLTAIDDHDDVHRIYAAIK